MSRAITKTVQRRAGWTRLTPPSAKACTWQHDASGFVVQHCGHATAIWPYYAQGPTDGRIVVTHNGLGFRTLFDAFVQVEDLVAGRRGTSVRLYSKGGRGGAGDGGEILCIDAEPVEPHRPLNEIVELLPLEQRIRAMGEIIDSMELGS